MKISGLRYNEPYTIQRKKAQEKCQKDLRVCAFFVVVVLYIYIYFKSNCACVRENPHLRNSDYICLYAFGDTGTTTFPSAPHIQNICIYDLRTKYTHHQKMLRTITKKKQDKQGCHIYIQRIHVYTQTFQESLRIIQSYIIIWHRVNIADLARISNKF